MRIDVIARRWGGPDGGPDGMAVAAAFLAYTLCALGHQVRGYAGAVGRPAWSHPRLEWRERSPLYGPDTFEADLVITTVSGMWRRTAADAVRDGAADRTVYWHHHGAALPPSHSCRLAAPPAIAGADVVLPPSSWAAEVGGARTGDAILVPGAGPAKGGHVALAVARLLPDLRWYVLPGRCSSADLAPWRELPGAEIAPGRVMPQAFLERARAVLSPTRFEVHPLTLVEAAVRGIPIVCTELPSTRAAAGEAGTYVPLNAPAEAWAAALLGALRYPPPPLKLPPYETVVATALYRLQGARRAA